MQGGYWLTGWQPCQHITAKPSRGSRGSLLLQCYSVAKGGSCVANPTAYSGLTGMPNYGPPFRQSLFIAMVHLPNRKNLAALSTFTLCRCLKRVDSLMFSLRALQDNTRGMS
jgi:hypothetical protein